jgi:hypothetical protein
VVEELNRRVESVSESRTVGLKRRNGGRPKSRLAPVYNLRQWLKNIFPAEGGDSFGRGAGYENGVLRPLEALPISDKQHVLVTISSVPVTASDVVGFSTLRNGKRRNTTILVWTRFDELWRQSRVHSRTQ